MSAANRSSRNILVLALFFHGWSCTSVYGQVELRKAVVVHLAGPGPSATLAIPRGATSITHTFFPAAVSQDDATRQTGRIVKAVSLTCSGQAASVRIELRAFVEDRRIGSQVLSLVKFGRLGQDVRFSELAEFGLGPITAAIRELEPPDGEPVAIRGTVTERLPDRSYGDLIASADICFEEEFGRVRAKVVSGPTGAYRVQLPPARYIATVLHRVYRPYSTKPGFVVATSGSQTSNFFLLVTEPQCPPADRFPGHSTSGASDTDRPPTVWIRASQTQVRAGAPLLISVWATDDRGLTGIWWWGEATGDPQLDVAHSQDCQGETFSYAEWTIHPAKPGTLVFAANARDTAYGKRLGKPHQASEGSGIACVSVVVLP